MPNYYLKLFHPFLGSDELLVLNNICEFKVITMYYEILPNNGPNTT